VRVGRERWRIIGVYVKENIDGYLRKMKKKEGGKKGGR
jgi:hypothetical protein